MSGVALPNVCFIGKAGAGKTTCAEILVKKFGYERLSFATPLKVMLDTTTDRERLQEFGADVVRAYEPDAWVNLFVDALQRRQEEVHDSPSGWTPPGYTCDDARFLNEVHRLKVEGFVVVRVAASKVTRVDRLKRNGKLQDEAQLDHASETELDEFRADYRIINDGWSDALEDDLADILNRERS